MPPSRHGSRCHRCADQGAPEASRVTTTLHKTDGGTTVQLTQSNLTGGVSAAHRDGRADYEKNWSTMLEGLKKTVES